MDASLQDGMMQPLASLRRCCLFTSKPSPAKSKREEYLFGNRKETSVTAAQQGKLHRRQTKAELALGALVRTLDFILNARVSE